MDGKHKEHVKASWTKLGLSDDAKMTTAGAKFFEKLLTKHTDLKELFPFGGAKDIAADDRAKKHGHAVIKNLAEMVAAIGDESALNELLKKFGELHDQKKITAAHLEKLKDTFADFLGDHGQKDAETVAAWSALVDVLKTTVK